MLYFSRWKTAAILGTTLIVCLAALTNVLPAATFDSLPSWAQRKIVLGMDLRGGERYQLVVDREDVRRMLTEQLRDGVRNALRIDRVGYTGLKMHDDSVEVRVRDESNFSQALSRLRELAGLSVRDESSRVPPKTNVKVRPGEASITADHSGYVPVPLVELSVDGRLVRLTVTPAAIDQRAAQSRNQAVDFFNRSLRAFGAEFSVRPVGSDRVVLETATPGLAQRMRYYY
jgi:preprotein translocase subunit SecD